MRLTLLPPLLAPLALLAACGDDPEPAGDDARSATGEVIEGTISDAMLPLATVRSQPPLEDPAAATEENEAQGPGPAAPIQPFGTPGAGEQPESSGVESADSAADEPPAPAPAEAAEPEA